MRPQTFILRQPTALVAANWSIRTGWRPALVMGLDSSEGVWYKADGRDDSTFHVYTNPDATFDADRVNDVCKLTDDGFELGSNNLWIRQNATVITIIAFPGGDVEPRDITLNDSRIASFSDEYGDGNAYKPTPQDTGIYDWIRPAAS